MKEKLLGSTLIVGLMTSISRVLGFIRDQVIAIVFGANGNTDAFVVAQRIPNMLRRMVAEGAFSQAFVPVIAEYKNEHGEQATKKLVDHVAGTLLLWLLGITIIGVLAAPVLILLVASGFSADPEQAELATFMLRITFPYILFISMTALSAGILNSYGKFALPAFTPVLLNISIIACALLLAPRLEQPIVALAIGVLIAGVAQLLLQIPALQKIGLLPSLRFKRGHAGVSKILKLMLPALVGSSAAQINLLINTNLASFLIAGSVSWLYFSDRFVEFPLAIFGIAIATVILPKLSAETKQREQFSETINWGLKLNLLVILPATVGLIMLAQPILATLLQYRAFTAFDTEMASLSLATFALGLPAFAAIKVLAPGFFSRQDTKTPMRFALYSIAFNIAFNLVVVVPWIWKKLPAGHAVLALAAALAAYVNATLLYKRLRHEGAFNPGPEWRRFWQQIIPALIIMSLILFWIKPELANWQNWNALERAVRLVGLIAAGAGSYLITLLLCGARPGDFKNKVLS